MNTNTSNAAGKLNINVDKFNHKSDISFSLEIECSSEDEAKIIYDSILLEHLDSQIRSKSIMKIENNIIFIETVADELSILKASLYSYIRWIKVAESIYKLTSEQ
ncbi:KEOPS complex subunit Pcc1 [Methanothermococcus sp. Ax23]|uniref:KEOPS complex subunit Pcc1 n=1 Tax=Methanothermococcus sp. Ax23 TaxID=3156486 RepID=UPI003B9F8627